MGSYRGLVTPVGDGFSVRFLFTGGGMHVEWLPRMPHGRKGRRVLPAYREARDAFLRDLSEHLGTNIACVEA